MSGRKKPYTLGDGTPVPGVTSLLGLLAKPALVGWAGKTVATAAVEYGKACYQAGKNGDAIDGFPKWTEILYGKRDRAADDGTMAHDLFEARLTGNHDGFAMLMSKATPPARQAYDNAAHWLESSALQIESHERPLVSERYGFGGTPDGVARHGNKITIADWKTGGVYPEHIIQMAAYATLLKEVDGIVIDGVHLVRFSRDHGDFTHHYWSKDVLADGWVVFQSLLRLKPALDRLTKRAK